MYYLLAISVLVLVSIISAVYGGAQMWAGNANGFIWVVVGFACGLFSSVLSIKYGSRKSSP
ncbi:MAG: hypothetical protein G01um101429_811 [Parcubacteria group bacterium Gr01-1014_29]|nr:MAG: hypothetical protein G01um101429_811 [Parcubacteria group bacterium Gr01-1014_29]